MTTEQRQGLIEWAWHHAAPVIARWEKRLPGLDYEGAVGLRLCTLIDEFDAAKSKLKTWAWCHADFACRDIAREDTGVIHFPRKRPKTERALALTLSDFYHRVGSADSNQHVYEPTCLAVMDSPGSVERMDNLRDLIREADKRERVLVLGYYYEDRTMREIGADLGLSESRVSQMHTALIDRLREIHRDRTPAA